MKLIRTEDAVGCVLCHDITQIIRGVTKDAVFRKGHIVTEEDIEVLLSVGKEHLYIWEKEEGMLHENEAAKILYDICAGDNVHGSDVKEGKIELIADCDGVLEIERDILQGINSLGQMMIAGRHGGFPVKRGDKLAGTRVIPLVIEEERMKQAKDLAGGKNIFSVKPYVLKKAGIITSGSEVCKGLIEDTFSPVVIEKLEEYGIEACEHIVVGDEHEIITSNINAMIDKGLDMVIVTGGMSVDPDDRTPFAIKNTGADIVTYGAPVLPGAMFMLAYMEKSNKRIPVMGLPGCVMYAKRTVFDLVLPRIAADIRITEQDINAMGEGGLCLSCDVCTYPNCGFGK